MRAGGVVGLALLALGATARACDQPVELSLASGTLRPIVMTQVDGQDAPMLVDTGAQRTLLDGDAATRLGVWRDTWVSMTMQGVGGVERQRIADLQSFSIGGLPLQRHSVGGRLAVAVGHLPAADGAIGLLGMDMLGGMGVDLTLDPHRRSMMLYPAGTSCAPLPILSDAVRIPYEERRGSPVVVLEINRQPVRAILDTGADLSMLNEEAAARLGVTARAPVAGPPVRINGVGPGTLTLNRYAVDLTVGGMERNADFPIAVGGRPVSPGIDLLLGTDWIALHRLLIDGPAHQIGIAPVD